MKVVIVLLIFLFTVVDTSAQTTDGLPKSERKALKQTKKLRKRLLKGADFNQLAKKYSDDPGSAAYGGELGSVDLGQFVPEFEEAIRSLKPGEISEPVRTDFGYHLIELIAKDETTFTSRHILIKP
ncbi:MAG: peptidylprolyl isomerase [Bacteroidota bacterium]